LSAAIPEGSVRLNGARKVRRLGQPVVWAQVLDQSGMDDLGVLAELRFQDRDADAAAEHPH